MKKSFFALLLFPILFSCQSGDQKIDYCKAENEIIINSVFCVDFGLPLAEFSVKYPSGWDYYPPVKGNSNYHYVTLEKQDSGWISLDQTITFGINTLDANGYRYIEFSYQQLAEIQNLYEQQNVELSEEYIGQLNYEGVPYFIYKAKADYHEPSMKLEGKYQVICLLAHPPFGGKNGVFVTMAIKDDQPLPEWTDYLNEYCVGEIFRSLTWRTR